MPKLPVLTPKAAEKIILKEGFVLNRSKGSHRIYYHPLKNIRVTIPFHCKDLPKGTFQSILHQANIHRNDLFRK